ncbi:MAG: DUF2284 domain-containing protein [Thermoplasmata archaeon]
MVGVKRKGKGGASGAESWAMRQRATAEVKAGCRHWAGEYVSIALKMGALHAVPIRASEVVLDPRTYLKCMFGCKDWGKNWTCPSAPGAVKPWEFPMIMKRYRRALLIHCRDKKTSQEISFEIERRAFLDGHYFAFSMSDCALCEGCALPESCRNPRKARPAMQALGIDVYATARKQGLPIETLREEREPQNWYSLVLIE